MVQDRVAADEKLYAVNHHIMPSSHHMIKSREYVDPYQVLELEKEDIPILTYETVGDVAFDSTLFPEEYTDLPGVLTFRGNNYRTAPSYGYITPTSHTLHTEWSFRTNTHHRWGGGAGWTGQPSIVTWEKDVLDMMNVDSEFKEQESFTEVIYGSLDGSVYFAELETGKLTRPPLKVGGPIKGSVSVDPRGYPLLYVGQGVPDQAPIGYRIYSLIDGSELYFIEGMDPFAYRGWGAFDGAALINRESDQLVLGGENGLFYMANLHTEFNREKKSITVQPEKIKTRYQVQGNHYPGIENSVAVYRNIAYFADNGGSILAIDLTDQTPLFALEGIDDTDATIVIEEQDNRPVLYTGTEVDHQGSKGYCYIRKIDGLTGEVLWMIDYPAYSVPGVVGGMLATPVVGKESIDHLAIFTIARYQNVHSGLMIAVNKMTGEEEWRIEMPHYAWSSPVDVYTETGDAYLIQADSIGNLHLIEGTTGEMKDVINLGANIEASPAVYNNHIIVASRGGSIFAIKVE